jgi:hypothetical protein
LGFKPSLSSFVTSALKTETACFSETLESTYETTGVKTKDNTSLRIKFDLNYIEILARNVMK